MKSMISKTQLILEKRAQPTENSGGANNSSDGRVVRASACGAVESGLIPSRVKPITLKSVFTASLLDVQFSIEGAVRRTSRQFILVVPLGRTLARFPHLGVADRWLATPKRAWYSAVIAFS